MIDKSLKTEVKIHPEHLIVSIALALDFDDLVDLIAYQERERSPEKCRGLNRNYVNTTIAAALSRNGASAISTAQKHAENEAVVPDHVIEFVERELGFLYPELRDHPLRLADLEDELNQTQTETPKIEQDAQSSGDSAS